MKTVSISAILPARNAERYISGAVASVLTQTFADFELVVIDDGSTDKTGAILSEFQASDPRLRVLRNSGVGLVDALNYGVASTSAPYIARMDADDICLPDRFQRQLDFLRAHPDVAVVGSQVIFIDDNGSPWGKNTVLPHQANAVAEGLLSGCCIRHPTVLMRREAFEKVGGYRAELADAEDYDLWLRMVEHYSLRNLPEPLLHYRIHGGQVSEQRMWTQRMSRNLALLAAMERRQGKEDPIGSYACFSKGAPRQKCDGRGCSNCVCDSVRNFATAEQLIADPNEKQHPSHQELWRLLKYMSRITIGDGQQLRLRVLVELCRAAVRLHAPLMFVAALGMALRIHPSRTVRWLVAASFRHQA